MKFPAFFAVATLFVASFAQAQTQGFGGLYVSGGAAAQALSTTAAKMTAFTASLPSTSTGGDSSVVAVPASDHVSVVGGGTYLVHFDVTASMGTADIQALFTLREGATAITGATCKLEGEDVGVPVNASTSFVFTAAADANVSVYVASESGTPNITPIDANLVVIRLR